MEEEWYLKFIPGQADRPCESCPEPLSSVNTFPHFHSWWEIDMFLKDKLSLAATINSEEEAYVKGQTCLSARYLLSDSWCPESEW